MILNSVRWTDLTTGETFESFGAVLTWMKENTFQVRQFQFNRTIIETDNGQPTEIGSASGQIQVHQSTATLS